MTIIEKAQKIISKDKITLKDYQEFVALSKEVKPSEEFEFAWIAEGMELRLPEIAVLLDDPEYNFIED
jgi:hypothetical protein